jgi:hypothetical protein
MNATNFSSYGDYIASTLQPNSKFYANSLWARQIPSDLPVLVLELSKQEFKGMRHQGGRGSFGFGHIPFRTTDGNKRHVMTMRLQTEATQCYWLADTADEEIWKAIDAWKKQKLVPFVLRCGNKMMYTTTSYHPQGWADDKFRTEVCPEPSLQYWEIATSLASSGLVSAQATSDIRGVSLKNVVVSVLVTKRLRRFANEGDADIALRSKPPADAVASYFPSIVR